MTIHHVFANRSNIGDWLSARGIQRLLREADPTIAIEEHLVDEPFVADAIAALGDAPGDDIVVIGGGGLFMDYFEPFWSAFEPISRRLRFVMWGAGVVDLKDETSLPSRDLLVRIVARARIAIVRDDLTRRFLGLPLPEPVPCPSVAAVETVPLGRGLLHINNYTTVGAAAYSHMRVAGMRWAETTARTYRETNNRIEPGREDELAAVIRRYALSDVVVSSALHGCVIALAMGRPVIAVSGDRKIEAFMTAAGLGDWVLCQGDLDRLIPLLDIINRQPPVEAFVDDAIGANRDVARAVTRMAAAIGASPRTPTVLR